MALDRERVSVLLTRTYLDGLNSLVKAGIYIDRQSLIRAAIWNLLEKNGIRPFYREAARAQQHSTRLLAKRDS